MRELNTSMKRYHELDSLRGLASLAVFFSHIVGVSGVSNVYVMALNNSALHLFWDGNAAVIFFFVLSGFVLSIPFVNVNTERIDILLFLKKRVFRIYPAYVFAIIFSLFLKAVFYDAASMQGLSGWVRSFWTQTPSLAEIRDHVFMIGPSFNTDRINPVIWSLIYEMKVSIIFPFIVFIYWMTKKIASIAFIFCVSVLLSLILNKMLFLTISLFLIGFYLAKYRKVLVEKLISMSVLNKWMLALLGIFLYSIKFNIPINNLSDIGLNYFVSLGASIIIVLSLSVNQFSSFLALRPIKHLGKISYSFYLLHLPILLTCTSVCMKFSLPLIMIYVVSFGLSIIVSTIVYRHIELPFIEAGKNISLNYFIKSNGK